jgi:hypothetical protein
METPTCSVAVSNLTFCLPKLWSGALMIDKPALEEGAFSAVSAFFMGKPSPVESWSIASSGFEKSS